MTKDRYIELSETNTNLTREELEQGWFWGAEWDGMLIHTTWPEAECEGCLDTTRSREELDE